MYLKNIEYFIGYYKSRFDEIDSMDEKYVLYKKALYFTIIDGLSKSIYPKEGNRERIVDFLEEIVQWSEGSLLSLPHLNVYFKLYPEPRFKEFRKFLKDKYSLMIPGNVYNISQVDLKIKDISNQSNKLICDLFDKKNRNSIYQLQHYNLFYKYRNSLLHEMRPLSGEMRTMDKVDAPYYIHMLTWSTLDPSESGYWALYYTEPFLKRLCENSILKAKEYLVNENIDPLLLFDEGNYWIEELNI